MTSSCPSCWATNLLTAYHGFDPTRGSAHYRGIRRRRLPVRALHRVRRHRSGGQSRRLTGRDRAEGRLLHAGRTSSTPLAAPTASCGTSPPTRRRRMDARIVDGLRNFLDDPPAGHGPRRHQHPARPRSRARHPERDPGSAAPDALYQLRTADRRSRHAGRPEGHLQHRSIRSTSGPAGLPNTTCRAP